MDVADDFVPSYFRSRCAVYEPAIFDGRDEWANAHFLFVLKSICKTQ
jgi:hypothetical protein